MRGMLNLAKETQNYSIVNIATETDALTLEVDPAKQPCVTTLTDSKSIVTVFDLSDECNHETVVGAKDLGKKTAGGFGPSVMWQAMATNATRHKAGKKNDDDDDDDDEEEEEEEEEEEKEDDDC